MLLAVGWDCVEDFGVVGLHTVVVAAGVASLTRMDLVPTGRMRAGIVVGQLERGQTKKDQIN
jgi:hypothetical protein